MTADKRRFPSLQEAFGLVFVSFALSLILVLVIGNRDGRWTLLVYELAIVIPSVMYVLLRRFEFARVFRFHRVSWRVLLLAVPIGVGSGVILDEMDRLAQSVVPMDAQLLEALTGAMRIESPTDGFWLVSAVVLVAALGEEMLFRGLLQSVLERTVDTTKAVLYTALVFSFLHFNPWWGVQILILGMLAGVLVWRAGSLWPAVLLHGVNNGVALIAANIEPEKLDFYFMGEHVHPLWLVTGVFLTLAGFRIYYRWTS